TGRTVTPPDRLVGWEGRTPAARWLPGGCPAPAVLRGVVEGCGCPGDFQRAKRTQCRGLVAPKPVCVHEGRDRRPPQLRRKARPTLPDRGPRAVPRRGERPGQGLRSGIQQRLCDGRPF